jgi:hypothetical protein
MAEDNYKVEDGIYKYNKGEGQIAKEKEEAITAILMELDYH